MTTTTSGTELAEPVIPDHFPWTRTDFDPPALYEWLREERPVAEVPFRDGRTVWLVTRYDDVREILANPALSSDGGHANYPYMYDEQRRPAGQHSFHKSDPPVHTMFRRMFAKNFLVKRVEEMRPRIQQLVDDALDNLLAEEQPADFYKDFALMVPSTVLTWILGVPEKDIPYFNQLAEAHNGGHSGPESRARAIAAREEIRAYLGGLVDELEKLDDPGDHILGQLVRALHAGECTREDVIGNAHTILIAGHDTTASMAAMGTLTLLLHRDQFDELRTDPSLVPNAVEELLRYLSIVHLVVLRIATEDIEIGGVTIPAGSSVIPLNFSANRDDAHFPDAATFDIHRNVRDHLAFGYGIHQCIGQPLARVELQVIFETVARRVPTLELGVPVDQLDFKLENLIHGVHSLPVRW